MRTLCCVSIQSLVSVIGTDNLNQASHEVVVNLLQLVPLNFTSFFFFVYAKDIVWAVKLWPRQLIEQIVVRTSGCLNVTRLSKSVT